MIRYGIKLEDRNYNKDEVKSLLQQVVEGMLNEDLIKLENEVQNCQATNNLGMLAS